MDLFSIEPAREEKKILTVAQLTQHITDTLERQIGAVWVEGEVSNCRAQMSGHIYFTLKDSTAQISCVLFRGSAAQARITPADGLQLQAYGELSVYAARGQYQLIVKRIQAKGLGGLQARFEALKKQLQLEGLFAAERKQALPAFPRTIAVITSPTGAVIRDMMNVLSRRSPWLHLLLFPVRVQGAGAEQEIAAALSLIHQSSGKSLPTIDLIIIARGGGSLEDLWAFNEEVTARAAAQATIPLVSAIGHETDFTILDFVADLRAPTPSAAAELIAPDLLDLQRLLQDTRTSLQRRIATTLAQAARHLQLLARLLSRDADRILLPWRQRLDFASSALSRTGASLTTTPRQRLAHLAAHLQECRPATLLAKRRAHLQLIRERLHHHMRQVLRERLHRTHQLSHRLRTLSPDAVLRRGYARITTPSGRTLSDPAEIRPGDPILVRLRTGQLHAIVQEVDSKT